MNKPITHRDLEGAAPFVSPVPAGAATNAPAEPVFGLPPLLHAGVFGGFLLYLAIMWAAFGEAQLAIPFVVFVVFIAASFVVPALWARIAPGPQPKQDWAWFSAHGIDCATGHLSAGGAIAHVMLLPAMVVLWGVAVAIITALGR
ncbi:hypothetical protein [Sphingomonas sp.]|uniref:hypothetical protein n=1 Tax=Sphingomonas sp. TaxID=28214 RepID=UPI001D9F42F7|nr:hypothetical protein [Sphingomonas sp.]MBX9796215.1 hypothetical protein [Sphingomonas sp.]